MERLAKWDFIENPMTFEYAHYKEDRTLEQNKKFHAMIRDIARQVEFCGSLRSVEDWKRILMSAYRKEQGGDLQAVPGLRGEVVILGRLSTSELKSHEASDFIEWIYSEFPNVEWTE